MLKLGGKIIKRVLYKQRKRILKTFFVLFLVASWLLTGWPPIWPISRLGINTIRFPPEIQKAQAAVTPQGVLGFSETAADDNMQFLTYTSPSTFIDQGDSVDTTTNTNDIQHIRMEMAPTRDEMLSGQLEVNGTLHITRCVGGCDASSDWSEELEISGVGAATLACDATAGSCEQPYDIAYEQLGGRAVVFYGKLANDGYIFYNIWNGTSWSGESSFQFKSANLADTEWVRAVPEGDNLSPRRSNRILVIVEDANEDIRAMIYDNGSFGNLTTITDTSFTSDNSRDFDGAWESVSGNALVVWGEGTTAVVNPYRYKRFVNSTQTWDASATDVGNVHAATNTARWVNLSSHLYSDRIAATFYGNGADFRPGIWKADGSTEGWTFGTEDQSLESILMNEAVVTWERYNSGTAFAMFVYADASTVDVSDYQTWTAGTGFAGPTDMPGEMQDDAAMWKIYASPNSDEILAWGVEYSDDICSQRWSDGWDTDCSAEYSTTLPPDTATAHNEGDAFDFSYRWYSPWSRNWRFYSGSDTSNTPTTPLANENTTPTNFDPVSGNFRLRFSVAELSNMSQTDARKKLQYTTGDPDSPSTTWTDVDDAGGSGIWRYRDCDSGSGVCDDNSTLSATVLSGSPTAGWWVQDKDAAGGSNMDHSALQVRELEFSVEANNATGGTTYYFRMYDTDIQTPVFREQDNDGSSECAGSTCTYPSLTTQAVTTYTQNDFEWFVDEDSVSLTDAWPSGSLDLSENEVFTQLPASKRPLVSGDKIRIQINITVGTANLSSGSQAFQLEYVATSDCTTASGWATVGAVGSGTIWRFFDNTSLTDGITQVNQISTSTTGAEGRYLESNSSSWTNPNAVDIDQSMEWDFAVENNGASENTTYCFRVTKYGGTELDTYNSDSYPKLTTAPGISNLMRHGNFFQGEAEKGFFWTD